MSQHRQEVIKTVLDDFFNVKNEVYESFDDGFSSITLDEVDTTILSEAINQALEKSNEKI